MEKKTKITLDELLKRKEQMLEAKKKAATKELYIESLGGTITITEPKKEVVADAVGMEDQNGDKYIVLECVTEPPLKSQELMLAFGVSDPLDMPDAIFKPGEISAIAIECTKLAGYYGSVTAIEAAKN